MAPASACFTDNLPRLARQLARAVPGGYWVDDALVEAAQHGRLAALALLLPHRGPGDGMPVVLAAVEHGQVAAMLLLAEHLDLGMQGSRALIRAAELGQVAMVACLLPHSAPLTNNSRALGLAAQNGHTAVVDQLLPVSDVRADHSLVLRMAVRGGHLATVRQVLPHSDPRAMNSMALSWAVRRAKGREEPDVVAMIRLLAECSDVVAAAALLDGADAATEVDRLGVHGASALQRQALLAAFATVELPRTRAALRADQLAEASPPFTAHRRRRA